MFVRKKHNPSGVVSIQVIDKSSGRYKVFKTIGSSSDVFEVERLYLEGKRWLSAYLGNRDMFVVVERERQEKHVTENDYPQSVPL